VQVGSDDFRGVRFRLARSLATRCGCDRPGRIMELGNAPDGKPDKCDEGGEAQKETGVVHPYVGFPVRSDDAPRNGGEEQNEPGSDVFHRGLNSRITPAHDDDKHRHCGRKKDAEEGKTLAGHPTVGIPAQTEMGGYPRRQVLGAPQRPQSVHDRGS
jgi:hypothetical protein